MAITGKTKLIGVMGDPVEHSLSPVIHNAAIAHLALDYIYIPLPVKSADLAQALEGLRAIGLVGFSVTIPHKQTILPFLAEVKEVAQLVGAANTIWRTEKGWVGTNTDVEGFIAPLKKQPRNWETVTPVILGNGGAARAVVVGCQQLGCKELHVVGRDLQKLQLFQQSWHNLKAKIHIHPWSELSQLLPTTELLVNTTPIGMYPHIEATPVEEDLLKKLPAKAIAYDLIYTPKPTQFLKLAAKQGVQTQDGLEMLVIQGAAALQLWLNQPAPVEVMRQALLEYLG